MKPTASQVHTLNRRSFLKQTAGAAAAMAVPGCMTSRTPSKPAAHPNVLFLMTDEQRIDSLGCYGSSWAKSPHMDTLAKEGVVFQNAMTPSPLCTPARCSLLTGLYPSETGVWSNHNNPTEPLPYLTRTFEAAGYRTASFGKQHHNTCNLAFQEQEMIVLTEAVKYFNYAPQYPLEQYDAVRYPGPKYNWIFGGRFPEPLEKTAEYTVVQKTKDWLARRESGTPFFLQVSLNSPHTPVAVASPFDTAISEDAVRIPSETEPFPYYAPEPLKALREVSRSDRLTQEQIRKIRRYYYGLTSLTDHLLGDLLTWMRGKGLLDNTIVVFLSDHGAHLGDFGMFQKQTYFEPSWRVPYIFWCPSRIASGVRMTTPVSTVSMMPTLLELADLDAPEHLQQRSLAHALRRGHEPKKTPVFSGHSLASFDLYQGEINVAVREGDWKMSMWEAPNDQQRTLVNLADDPYERRNCITDPACRAVQSRLTRHIREHLAQGRVPNPEAC